MPKILIVEDEEMILQGLKLNMELENYEVEVAVNGEEALQKVESFEPDLILLDLMIPKISGMEVCRFIRKKHPTIWIIMLTAKADESSKIMGLEMGADDYVTKPFSILELLARIKSGLRRSSQIEIKTEEPTVVMGDIQFDFKKFTAIRGEEHLEFSPREYQILQFFWEHKGEVVLREDLLEKVWGYTPDNMPTTRTIDNHIVKLRQKIESDPSHPHILLSIRGVGYKLHV